MQRGRLADAELVDAGCEQGQSGADRHRVAAYGRGASAAEAARIGLHRGDGCAVDGQLERVVSAARGGKPGERDPRYVDSIAADLHGPTHRQPDWAGDDHGGSEVRTAA